MGGLLVVITMILMLSLLLTLSATMRLSLETIMSTRLRQTMSVSSTAMITMLPPLSVRMVSGLVTLSGASGAMRNHKHHNFRSENRDELNPFSLCAIFIFYTSSLISIVCDNVTSLTSILCIYVTSLTSIVCNYVTSLTSLTSIVRTYVTWPGSLIRYCSKKKTKK